jgi:hypothetical protein
MWIGSQPVACFDAVEINHKIDRDGKEQFVQIIAWNWCPEYQRFNCEGWAMAMDWRARERRVEFRANATGDWRLVRGESIRETWTRNDPEVDNQRVYPTACRQWKLNSD